MATCNFGSTIFSRYYSIMTEDESEFNFLHDNIAGAISDLDGGYLEKRGTIPDCKCFP